MSNLFEHCRTEISSASQRYEKPEAMQINLLFAEAKYSRCSQSAIFLCQSATGGGCAGRRRRSDAALCMGGCGLPLFGCGRRANLSKLYFSRPPACGIALQKQPNSHFGKHPAPPIGCLLQGADLPPFVTERWRQKCPQGTSVGIGRRCSLSGHKRLRCCDAKDCTASTVAARQSPQAASALACCPSFSRPLRALEPPSDLIPPPVQCGDSCALCAMIIIRLRPHMAGLRPAGSHCEKSGKIPTLHCIPPGMTNPVILRRKSKPIPTQASPPASPSKQRRKRPCPIGFRHICPKTEK